MIEPICSHKTGPFGVDEWRVPLPFGCGSLVFKSKAAAEAACAAINAWLGKLDDLLLVARWEAPQEDEDKKSHPQTEPVLHLPASTSNGGVPIIHDLAGAMVTISMILFLARPAFQVRQDALEALERFAGKWREIEAGVRRLKLKKDPGPVKPGM